MLGVLPGVHGALALTESLISGGCSAHCIFLMMALESTASPDLRQGSLLASIGEHRGTSVYCVADRKISTEQPVLHQSVQQRRFVHLIDHFAKYFPTAWAFHHDLIRDGSPVGIVHLDAPIEDEPSIVRTVLAHSVTRVQVSDIPNLPITG